MDFIVWVDSEFDGDFIVRVTADDADGVNAAVDAELDLPIAGYREEPAEAEAWLAAHPEVAAAVAEGTVGRILFYEGALVLL